jgi:hypothetical protein
VQDREVVEGEEVSYTEPPQTNKFDIVQQTLKAYQDAPFHYLASWTGQPKWGTLLQLVKDNPFKESVFKRPLISCTNWSTQFKNWAQTQIYGLCFGACHGEINNEGQKPMFHAWNWTICDGKLVFIDYQGTMPAFAVPNTGYWIMESSKIREFRKVNEWYL